MKRLVYTTGLTLLLLAGADPAMAAVPLSINYSGELVETTSGTEQEIADKNTVFYVRLYASATSTQPLWARQYSVLLNKGKFTLELSESGGSDLGGASTSSLRQALRLQADDPSSEALYIGVRPFDDQPNMEISPRQRVVSVPFAMLANDVTRARRNFAVTNGKVSVKNLTVLQSAVFSNGFTVAAAQGTTTVQFASAPLFKGGVANSQSDKVLQVAKSATAAGAMTFNSGLSVTTLTSSAAATFNNGLVVKQATALNGDLSVKNGLTVGSGGTTVVGGGLAPANGISVLSSGSVTLTNLFLTSSSFPFASMLDSTILSYVANSSTQGAWQAPKDCFVIAVVGFNGSGGTGTKLSARFYASPTSTVGTGTYITEAGMGTVLSEPGYTTFQGTETVSFFLKSGEYLTWVSSNGTINLKLVYRTFTYSY